MLFNSYVFILAFFPGVMLGWFLLHRFRLHRAALFFLAVMSLVFYGYNNVRYVPVIVCSVLCNYALSKAFTSEKLSARVTWRRVLFFAGIAFNIGLIFYFKYYNFFLENMNALFHADFVLKKIALPLGISFFTFQQVSYLVDSWRGETKDYGFLEYAVFVTYFPQLVAGPIVLHNEMIPQFRDGSLHRINADNVANGLILFILGLFKKVVIADTLSGAVAWGFGNVGAMTAGDAFFVMFAYTFQIYFDFSGYCDMASGMARMMNISLPMNFDSPYKALSIREFWKRWHLTLTRFLTRYVYVPLGGSRRGIRRTCINTILVFLLSGLWHGANWTFVLWGLLHGLFSVGERLLDYARERRASRGGVTDAANGDDPPRIHAAARWIYTFLAVNVLWLLFRADSVAQWKDILSVMLRMENLAISDDLLWTFVLPENQILYGFGILAKLNGFVRGFPAVVVFLFAYLVCMLPENNVRRQVRPRTSVWMVPVCAVALTWSLLCLSSESVFLYFNF